MSKRTMKFKAEASKYLGHMLMYFCITTAFFFAWAFIYSIETSAWWKMPSLVMVGSLVCMGILMLLGSWLNFVGAASKYSESIQQDEQTLDADNQG